MGGRAVVKNPYSNAGQGVYTIVNQTELDAFMAEDHAYNKFIVQALIGNNAWSSTTSSGQASVLVQRKKEIRIQNLEAHLPTTTTNAEVLFTRCSRARQLFHLGTIPNKKRNIYVCDFRLQVAFGKRTAAVSSVAPSAAKSKKERSPRPKEAIASAARAAKAAAAAAQATPQWGKIACYARRARVPLQAVIEKGADSWAQLGTNLSVPLGNGKVS